MKSYWKYLLLIVPISFAILALNGYGFFFKSGTAGVGILILLFLFFFNPTKNKDVWMIIGAFSFSIAGDWFLSNMEGDSGMFIAGIALCFLAHIGYLAFALFNGKVNKVVTIALIVGFLIFYFITLYPVIEVGILKISVLIYLLISCFSLGVVVGIKVGSVVRWSYSFEIALILFSDTIISFKEFIGYRELNSLILPTYYAAHIAVTFALIKRFCQ